MIATTKIRSLIFALLLFHLAAPPPLVCHASDQLQPTDQNYCHDPATWADWESLLEKHPGDTQIRYLYGLRIGLCEMVRRNELTIDQAQRLFEEQRSAVMQGMAEEREGELGTQNII